MDVLRRLAQPGASYASVAHRLGISESAARMRMTRLFERLREESGLPISNALQAANLLGLFEVKSRRVKALPPMESLWERPS